MNFQKEDFYSEENIGKSSGKRVILGIFPWSTKRRAIGTRNIFLVLTFWSRMCTTDSLSRDKISLEKLALISRLGSLNVALETYFTET